jgi:hypothetical protein
MVFEKLSEKERISRSMQVLACITTLGLASFTGCNIEMGTAPGATTRKTTCCGRQTITEAETGRIAAEKEAEETEIVPQSAPKTEKKEWSGGTLTAHVEASLARTYRAARLSLAKMGMPIDQQKLEPMTGSVSASLGEGEELQVGLKRMSSDVTRVRIRVGFIGDEEQSRSVLSEIQNQL